jgi:hypothetical protein
VTPFATQHERQAILDAAELAGLNVLSLMHDETAGKGKREDQWKKHCLTCH